MDDNHVMPCKLDCSDTSSCASLLIKSADGAVACKCSVNIYTQLVLKSKALVHFL